MSLAESLDILYEDNHCIAREAERGAVHALRRQGTNLDRSLRNISRRNIANRARCSSASSIASTSRLRA